jgi:hypothetical protein
MPERRTDTEHSIAPDDPPGAVSNQNGEQAESALRDDQTHPEPPTRADVGDRDVSNAASGETEQPKGHSENAG